MTQQAQTAGAKPAAPVQSAAEKNGGLTSCTLLEFSDLLGAKVSAPGGGAACAYSASLAAALGSMVVNFTLGKARYAAYQEELGQILERCQQVAREMVAGVEKDAEAFGQISAAWALPKEDPQREVALVQAAKLGSEPAFEVLRAVDALTPDLERLVNIGSRLLISDVGCAAALARAAVEAAALNVKINTRSCSDAAWATAAHAQCESSVARVVPRLSAVYDAVAKQLERKA